MITASHPKALRAKGAWDFCTATVGNFDGVHLGHQKLLRAAVQHAHALAMPAVAVTFGTHPASVLGECAPKVLCSAQQRLEYLKACGIDAVLMLPFTKALASLTAGQFCLSVLKEGLCVRDLCIGYDFRMGRDRAGAKELSEFFPCVIPVGAEMIDGEPVSSTRIRQNLAQGRLKEANSLLGRPFSVQGSIVHGQGRGGALLGIPTANLHVDDAQAMPAPAVYATSARLLEKGGWGKWRMSVSSFCKNPTFGASSLTLETHILDFSQDIYGRSLEVRFLSLMRKDRRFDGPDALIAQLHADIEERRSLSL